MPAAPIADETLAALACPVCGGGLRMHEAAIGCDAGHRFDRAKQGHLALLAGRTAFASDTAEMVAARDRFLDGGWYAPTAAALAEAAASEAPQARLVLDVGGGTGWYAARVLDALPDARAVSLDLSKPAAARAARAHPLLASIVADAWSGLPLQDGSVDVALSVFAPRNAEELARVLAPGGVLLVAVPGPEHLTELVEPLGMLRVDPRKQERLAQRLGAFERGAVREVRETLRLDRAAARDLVLMGPSAFHADPAQLDERLAALPEPIAATLAVTVAAYRLR